MGLTKTQSGGLADDAKTTINNNADNRVITGSGTANTLNAESGVVIDSSGKVGIGTTSPAHKLHVEGSASGVISAKQTTNNGGFNIYEGDASDGTTKFYVTHNGRVGAADGIIFGTDTAAGNILNDYEEGTWTPTIAATAANPSFTFLSNNPKGYYTKVGKLVTLWYDIAWSALPSQGGGTLIIQNFPYNTDGNFYAGFGLMSHTVGTTAGGYVADKHMHYANANASFMYVLTGSSTNGHMQTSALSSSGHIFGGFTYRAV